MHFHTSSVKSKKATSYNMNYAPFFPDGKEMAFTASHTYNDELELMSRHNIDMHAEMLSTMMYQMAMEMHNVR